MTAPEEENLPPRKLKITGGEHRFDVAVRDAETGSLIANVTRVWWSYTAGNAEARCVVELLDVEVEMNVEQPQYRWIRPSDREHSQ